MNKLGLKNTIEEKRDRIIDRLNISPNKHKYIKETIELYFLNKRFALKMTSL